MRVYRVYTIEAEKAVSERFYTIEKLVEYLIGKNAYYRHYGQPITKEFIEMYAERGCVDVIIPASKEVSMWELMGFKNEDELLRIYELDIIK